MAPNGRLPSHSGGLMGQGSSLKRSLPPSDIQNPRAAKRGPLEPRGAERDAQIRMLLGRREITEGSDTPRKGPSTGSSSLIDLTGMDEEVANRGIASTTLPHQRQSHSTKIANAFSAVKAAGDRENSMVQPKPVTKGGTQRTPTIKRAPAPSARKVANMPFLDDDSASDNEDDEPEAAESEDQDDNMTYSLGVQTSANGTGSSNYQLHSPRPDGCRPAAIATRTEQLRAADSPFFQPSAIKEKTRVEEDNKTKAEALQQAQLEAERLRKRRQEETKAQREREILQEQEHLRRAEIAAANKAYQEAQAKELRAKQYAKRLRDYNNLDPVEKTKYDQREAARQGNIRKKEERNAKNKAAIAAAEGESGGDNSEGEDAYDETDELQIDKEGENNGAARPVSHRVAHIQDPKGPIGLIEYARQQEAHQSKASGSTTGPKPRERERLHDVTYADARMLLLRETDGMETATREYNELTGKSWKSSTLARRAQRVTKAIKDAGVPEQLIKDIKAGREGAVEDVNRVIYGDDWYPSQPQPKEPRVLRDTHTHMHKPSAVERPMPLPKPKATPPKRLQSSAGFADQLRALERENSELRKRLRDGATKDDLDSSSRRKLAGKSLGPELTAELLRELAEFENAPPPDFRDEDAVVEREASPVNDQDYCHYAYQPEWRACRYEDHANIAEFDDPKKAIEEQEWLALGEPTEILGDADAIASHEALRVGRGTRSIMDSTGNYNVSRSSHPTTGMPIHELSSSLGIIQVKVVRFLRTYRERVIPEFKEQWQSKTVFTVRSFIRNVSQDVVTEEVNTTIEERSDGIFTALKMANYAAIERWIDLTVKPKTARLTEIGIAKTEAKMALREEVDVLGDEGKGFEKEYDGGDGVDVRVWVTEEKLQGPRNI